MPISVSTRVSKFHRVDASPDGAVRDGVDDAMEQATGAGFQKSQELVPVDTSELMFSGVPPYKDERGNWIWGYDAPHTLPVEFGAVPHWVPIEPLLGWARRVLGDESAAYAVQQKIAEEGTEPQPFVRPGVNLQKLVLKTTGIQTHIKKHIPGL